MGDEVDALMEMTGIPNWGDCMIIPAVIIVTCLFALWFLTAEKGIAYEEPNDRPNINKIAIRGGVVRKVECTDHRYG